MKADNLQVEQNKEDWEITERVKPPWIKDTVNYSKTILPPNDQKSNNTFADEQIFQPRDEAIGKSFAPPIGGRGQDKGAIETSHSKQIHGSGS